MLTDTLRKQALEASKARDSVTATILRLALGELQAHEARTGRAPSEEEGHAVLRKLVKSNEETLAVSEDAEQKSVLQREIEVLRALLPRSLSVEEIAAKLGEVADAIRAASNDGAATGVAMKHLRAQQLTVDGQTVGAAVKQIRAGS